MLDTALLTRFEAALAQLSACLPRERQPQPKASFTAPPPQRALQNPVRHFFAQTAWEGPQAVQTSSALPHAALPHAALPHAALPHAALAPSSLNTALGDYFGKVAWQGRAQAPVQEAPVPTALAQSLQAVPPPAAVHRVTATPQQLSVQGFFQQTAWTGADPVKAPAAATEQALSQTPPPPDPEDDIDHFFSDIRW